jgi:hypothetical protein
MNIVLIKGIANGGLISPTLTGSSVPPAARALLPAARWNMEFACHRPAVVTRRSLCQVAGEFMPKRNALVLITTNRVGGLTLRPAQQLAPNVVGGVFVVLGTRRFAFHAYLQLRRPSDEARDRIKSGQQGESLGEPPTGDFACAAASDRHGLRTGAV